MPLVCIRLASAAPFGWYACKHGRAGAARQLKRAQRAPDRARAYHGHHLSPETWAGRACQTQRHTGRAPSAPPCPPQCAHGRWGAPQRTGQTCRRQQQIRQGASRPQSRPSAAAVRAWGMDEVRQGRAPHSATAETCLGSSLVGGATGGPAPRNSHGRGAQHLCARPNTSDPRSACWSGR